MVYISTHILKNKRCILGYGLFQMWLQQLKNTMPIKRYQFNAITALSAVEKYNTSATNSPLVSLLFPSHIFVHLTT